MIYMSLPAIGRLTSSDCSSLKKSISVSGLVVTDSMTGRSTKSECTLLGKFVSLPSRAVPCRHRLHDRSVDYI